MRQALIRKTTHQLSHDENGINKILKSRIKTSLIAIVDDQNVLSLSDSILGKCESMEIMGVRSGFLELKDYTRIHLGRQVTKDYSLSQ